MKTSEKIAKLLSLVQEAQRLMGDIEKDLTRTADIPLPVTALRLRGSETRFLNWCKREDIQTIGQLLQYGKINFMKDRDIGKKTVGAVDDALREQFAVESW